MRSDVVPGAVPPRADHPPRAVSPRSRPPSATGTASPGAVRHREPAAAAVPRRVRLVRRILERLGQALLLAIHARIEAHRGQALPRRVAVARRFGCVRRCRSLISRRLAANYAMAAKILAPPRTGRAAPSNAAPRPPRTTPRSFTWTGRSGSCRSAPPARAPRTAPALAGCDGRGLPCLSASVIAKLLASSWLALWLGLWLGCATKSCTCGL